MFRSQSFLLGSRALGGSYTYEPILIYLSFVLGNHSLSSFDASGLWKVCSWFSPVLGLLGRQWFLGLPVSEQQSCFVYDWLHHPYHHLVTCFYTSIPWVYLDCLFPLIRHNKQVLQSSITSMYSMVFPFSASVPLSVSPNHTQQTIAAVGHYQHVFYGIPVLGPCTVTLPLSKCVRV